jgi:hypothetical protein
MHQNNQELWYAFIAIVAITILYLFVVISLGGVPAASEFFGHSLGILGFMLMVMTETLYSFRKRRRSARWGRMSAWLQFHIFTGLVGPYLVLLHTSWKFNGLAGVVMLMTGLVVASGFVGRYIYTAIPRTADGIEMETIELERQFRTTEAELRDWLASRPQVSPVLKQRLTDLVAIANNSSLLTLSTPIGYWRSSLQWWIHKLNMDATRRAQVGQLESILRHYRILRRQRAAFAQSRRLLALWHSIHIPIGMALFTAAVIHIGAAIYYATLLH